MQHGDSILDQAAMRRARALLATPSEPERVWPALAAATFAAVAALTLAVAMVVAPPVTTSHLPADELGR
jgi:hypothetical protein